MISPEVAAFLEAGQSIYIGTCDRALRPEGARAIAATVDEGRASLTLYVPQVAVHRVLPNLEATGQAAVVFARPSDDHAYQVKGTFMSARPAEARERAVVEAQWKGFQQNLDIIGVSHRLVERWPHWPCMAVRLQVTALFNQTPGPGAGASVA